MKLFSNKNCKGHIIYKQKLNKCKSSHQSTKEELLIFESQMCRIQSKIFFSWFKEGKFLRFILFKNMLIFICFVYIWICKSGLSSVEEMPLSEWKRNLKFWFKTFQKIQLKTDPVALCQNDSKNQNWIFSAYIRCVQKLPECFLIMIKWVINSVSSL